MLQLLLVCEAGLAERKTGEGGGCSFALSWCVLTQFCECVRARRLYVSCHISRQESAKALEAKKLLEAKAAEVFPFPYW